MRGRAAHVKVLDWRTILRPTGSGAQGEKLLQSQLTLEDVSFRQPKFAFEIERRYDLPVQNDVFNVRGVLCDGVDDGIAELFALLVPVPFLQIVRRVLHET